MRKKARWAFTGKQIVVILMLIAFTVVNTSAYAAKDVICAEVKIVIEQKFSFERQAFDAKMVIRNGLTEAALENINIDLLFFDRNMQPVEASDHGGASEALFFYRTDSTSGIDSFDGEGRLDESSTAEIHWLIIPTAGAAADDPLGKIYYVGAKVTYTFKGETKTVEIDPDFIRVKPLPELTLDYFLPKDVYGDDAFTLEVEPAEPFTLGLRVTNSGAGLSKNTQIESAQVQVVENKQGLLIDYKILGGYVANQLFGKSLLLNLGDIAPGASQVGRWVMVSSLSGQFVEFSASYTHAETLGGELTSVIKEVNTHTLVHDVKVDAPGRDDVLDFLALDGDILRIYESEGGNALVENYSEASQLTTNGGHAEITFPASADFVYSKFSDPWQGRGSITNLRRSDGKLIPTENIWRSKTRNKDMSWSYFINVFDIDSTGKYTFSYSDVEQQARNMGGKIYYDINRNHIQDSNEIGIPGLAVTLTQNKTNGLSGVIISYTDAQGNYNFDQLKPGDYSLEIEPLTIVMGSSDEGDKQQVVKQSNDIVHFKITDELKIEMAQSGQQGVTP